MGVFIHGITNVWSKALGAPAYELIGWSSRDIVVVLAAILVIALAPGRRLRQAGRACGCRRRRSEREGRDEQGEPRCFFGRRSAIGDTPLVELARITRGVEGRILAKLEYLNPGFSKKDRIARQIVEDAEADGSLRPGQTVVELTSGNTGTGLAIVCGVKGYPFVAVMSKGNSTERARMMAALGAEVVLVDQAAGLGPRPGLGRRPRAGRAGGAADRGRARRLPRRPVPPRPATSRAHYLHTAPEILRQAGGRIDAFCDFAGLGRVVRRVRGRLKERDPRSAATSSSRRAPRCSPASRSPTRTTASRAAATRWPSCRCCAASTSTALSRWPTRRRSRGAPAGARGGDLRRVLVGRECRGRAPAARGAAPREDGGGPAQRFGPEVPQHRPVEVEPAPERRPDAKRAGMRGFRPASRLFPRSGAALQNSARNPSSYRRGCCQESASPCFAVPQPVV